MTTHPTLRQRIRLADTIVLADGWRAGDAWCDDPDEPERTPNLVTVRPTRVLKGEPEERVTLLTADRERLAAAFDTPGRAVLLLRRDPVARRYVLLFDTVLPVDGDRVQVPENMADDASRSGLTVDDLAALVAEDAVGSRCAEPGQPA
jgi:hypothetical protein